MSATYNNKKDYFKEGVRSLFIVCSPLQAMCALNAIKDFHIDEYEFLLVLEKDKRNKQLFTLLDKHAIRYDIIHTYEQSKSYAYRVFNQPPNAFKRVFIGDRRNLMMVATAFQKAANGSNIVFLDDGNETISFLKGMKCLPLGFLAACKTVVVNMFYKLVGQLRNIRYGKFIYTIYDIPNQNFEMKLNKLDLFLKKKEDCRQEGVYVIGTNFTEYCPGYVSKQVCEKQMRQLFCQLKKEYTDMPVYYIPHGRDIETFPERLCKEYDVIYRPVDISVEIYMSELNNIPSAIYGYTSSALMNLKKMFPASRVVDMVFKVKHETNQSKGLFLVSDYYETAGIERMWFDE